MITYHVVDVQEVDKVAPFFSSAYRGWLHDPAMVVYCAKDDDLVVGAMGVLLGEQVAKILSLSVSPDYQRKGIGTGLVAQAQADLEFYECDSLQVNFSLDLENTWELAGLFDHAGFDVIEHSPVSRTCKVQDLLQSSITKKAAQYPREQIVPLESVPPVALQMYCNTFRLDLDLKDLDGSLSMVAMNKGSVTGLLAIQKIGPQEIDAILLHVPFGWRINIIFLMVATATKAVQTMGEDCVFSMALPTQAGKQLFDKLLPPQEDNDDIDFLQMVWQPE